MSNFATTTFVLLCLLSSTAAVSRHRRQNFDFFNPPSGSDSGNGDYDASDNCFPMCDWGNPCNENQVCVTEPDCSIGCKDKEPSEPALGRVVDPTGVNGTTSQVSNSIPVSPPSDSGGTSNGTGPAKGKDGNAEGQSFSFGGDADWDNGAAVPTVPASFPVPPADPPNTDTIEFPFGCPPTCVLANPCNRNQECEVHPDCSTTCKDTVSSTPRLGRIVGPTTTRDPTGLRPLSERECKTGIGFVCQHGYCEDTTCICDDGWTGFQCEVGCTRKCQNDGVCHVIDGKEFCNCNHKYEGKYCESLIPDPKENARVLAGGLSSALAVALLLLVVTPIILWRMRVIFVLKLVYYFKEYEDHDGKSIDAYVSMTPTSTAENFVYRSLQPKLEQLGFKLYLQARDSPVGEVMSETILKALEKSRRTIMIITHDYVNNEWNRFEYLIAQHETLKLRQRIIPIILEDVDQERVNMDKSLKHILDSIKCLKFPQAKPSNSSGNVEKEDNTKETKKLKLKEDKFWKRLELTMPKKKKEEKSDKAADSDKDHKYSDRDEGNKGATQIQTQDIVNSLALDKKISNDNLSANFVDLGTKGMFKKNQNMVDVSQVYLDMEV